MRAISISALCIHITTWIFSLHSSIYVNKSVRNDDGQSDGDEDDGG